VTLYAGFTCPVRDGTVSTGGCAFCSPEASAPPSELSVEEQLAEGMERVGRRFRTRRFLAYFNDHTATYGPVGRLEKLLDDALRPPPVVGVALGTRPDCLEQDVVELLAEVGKRTYLWVEMGLQTASDKSLAALGRGHGVRDFAEAAERLGKRSIRVCAHVILGLPGEDLEDDLRTARLLSETPVCGVKIHNFHVLRGSRWADEHHRGRIHPIKRRVFVERCVTFLEHLPAGMVVHRLVGDAPARFLLSPQWCLDKQGVLMDIRSELGRRSGWQGRALGARPEEVVANLEKAEPLLPI
jgi:radical SAM protein (TIGR01212 family)